MSHPTSMPSEPDFTSWPQYRSLETQLRLLGFVLVADESSLSAGGETIRSDLFRVEPQRQAALLLRHCKNRRQALMAQRPQNLHPYRGTLPGQEFTSGGQHISERSG